MGTHGGKRPGAGRKPGAVSLAKREIAEAAKEHGPNALRTIVMLMEQGESDQVKLAAAREVLDRAYGRPMQGVQHGGDPDNPLPAAIAVHFVGADGKD